jgi:hypothetical protein
MDSSYRKEIDVMAKTVVTQYTDDLDGSKAQGTVSFSYAGAAYEIDLSAKNTKAFETALNPYIAAARRVRAKSARATRRSTRATKVAASNGLAEIRAWAKGNGYTVADRGRISASVIEAFENSR